MKDKVAKLKEEKVKKALRPLVREVVRKQRLKESPDVISKLEVAYRALDAVLQAYDRKPPEDDSWGFTSEEDESLETAKKALSMNLYGLKNR